jgi:hypothetical protein
MKPRTKPPEQLLAQLVENSACLIRAELKLSVSSHHRDELARAVEKQLAFTRRMEQLMLLLLLVSCVLGFGYVLHLSFPHWLPEQWAAVSSTIKNL